MKKIIIDGSFISRQVTGVPRVCWQLVKELTKSNDFEWYIAIPEKANSEQIEKIPNLKILRIKGFKNLKLWQLISLSKVVRKIKGEILSLANFSPFYKKGYLLLHDVTFLEKEGKSKRLWSFIVKVLISFRFNKNKKVITVSNFSKERICYYFKKYPKDNVYVIGNGGDFYNDIKDERPKTISENCNDFFLSVGSTTANKNFNYILELGKKYKDKIFVITGRLDDSYKDVVGKYKNIILTGYVNDSNLLYLYKNCKALILPSTYEGFGLPPIESIFYGNKCLVLSNIPVFREVYGDAANYLNPNDYQNLVDLDNLKLITDEQINELKNKYCWNQVAKNLLSILKEN